jgi:5-methylcytosine-specific restriction endonuclease McrA
MSRRQNIRVKLDELVKTFVRKRDNYTCQRCLKQVTGYNCHVSHVIPVSATLSLAYDPLNMKILCYFCHFHWWHKNPLEAAQWFKDKFPERWKYLKQRRKEPKVPIKDFQLEELYSKLKSELGD